MRNIGININSSKDIEGKILNNIIEMVYNQIEGAKIQVFNDSFGFTKDIAETLDFIISLGGDGTFLRTARMVVEYNIPILGVNIGNLGFLTSVEISNFEYALKCIRNNEYSIEKRKMLQCSLSENDSQHKYLLLNDAVIAKGTLARMIEFDIYVDNCFYTSYTADGVIVSTPTGSTAYSLSAGGPIIYPTLELITITPICPHYLGMRTVVFDGSSKIKILIKKRHESIFLTVDGQESVELNNSQSIFIQSSNYDCNIIKLKGYDYFKVLRKKIISRTK